MNVTLSVQVPDALSTARRRVTSYWTRILDWLFEARAEQVYAVDRLDLARRLDDRESAIQLPIYREMQVCGCPCCRKHLPPLLEAEEIDQAEGAERERARQHVEAAGEYVKPTIALLDAALVKEASYEKSEAAA